jgi:hypothetical protein
MANLTRAHRELLTPSRPRQQQLRPMRKPSAVRGVSEAPDGIYLARRKRNLP